MKRLTISIILSVLVTFLSGCIPLLAGTAVYGIHKASANKTERMKAYGQYKLELERLNIEREVKGLDPLLIESFEEWNFKVDSQK